MFYVLFIFVKLLLEKHSKLYSQYCQGIKLYDLNRDTKKLDKTCEYLHIQQEFIVSLTGNFSCII